MQYLLLIYSHEADFAKIDDAQRTQMIHAYSAYTEALRGAGVLTASDRLRPSSSATTVRVRDGKSAVLNGPYADTREQLAGYYQIDVPDLDAALGWAARCPGASYGTMEVRPVWSM